jgi:hypothetical protein
VLGELVALLQDGKDEVTDPETGVMIEVPLNVKMAEALHREIDNPRGNRAKIIKLYLDLAKIFGPKPGACRGGFKVYLYGAGYDPGHRRDAPGRSVVTSETG